MPSGACPQSHTVGLGSMCKFCSGTPYFSLYFGTSETFCQTRTDVITTTHNQNIHPKIAQRKLKTAVAISVSAFFKACEFIFNVCIGILRLTVCGTKSSVVV